MTSDEARGLTSQQAWTLEHIERCYCCGAWTVVTKHGGAKPATCQHLTPKRKAVA
jgi:hypothetical protein